MSRTLYLVARCALNRDGTVCDNQFTHDTGSRVPLRLFADRAAAAAFVAAHLATARRTMNPFHLLGRYLRADEREKLLALEFPLQCPDDTWRGDWLEWWDLCQDEISDEQRAAVWELFGELPYEIVAVEVDDE